MSNSKAATADALDLVFACPFAEPAIEYGGPVEFLRQVCSRLAARGHRVRVVTTDLGVPSELPRQTWIERPGKYTCYYAPTGPMARVAPHFAPKVRRGLQEALADKPDLLALNLGFTHLNLVGRRVAAAAGVPYVFTPHGVYGQNHLQRRKFSKRLYSRLFEQRVVAGASRIQALARAEADAIEAFGADPEKIRIIPNGIDLADFDQRQPGTPLAAQCNFPPSDRVILFLSRLNESKGLDLLIPAFAAARKRAPAPWQLVLAGPDNNWVHIGRQLAADHGVAETVHFPGPLRGADKFQALADADLFALTSYAEGMPVSVLEACAAKLPVLITDRCNLPAVAEAHAGSICSADAPSVEAALTHLLVEAPLTKMGAAARSLVEVKYTWEVVVKQLEDFYQEALVQPGCPDGLTTK